MSNLNIVFPPCQHQIDFISCDDLAELREFASLSIFGPLCGLPRDALVSQRLFLGLVKLRTLSRQARAIHPRNLFFERSLNNMASVGEDMRPHQSIDPLQKRLIYRDSYLCDTHTKVTSGHRPGQAGSVLSISPGRKLAACATIVRNYHPHQGK